MRKPRPALAAKGSQNALPARATPYVLDPLGKQQSAAPSTAAGPKPKKSGLAALKQQLGAINARAPVEQVTKDQARDSSDAPVEHKTPAPRAETAAPPAPTVDRQQQQALPRSPRPAPRAKSPAKRAASVLRNEPPPPSPSDAGSDLTYVTVDDDGEPVRPLPPALELELEQAAPPTAQKRVLDISPIVLPTQNARGDSPWPERQPAFEYVADEDQADEQEMEDDEEQFEDPFMAPPPAQQVRRPYEPRQARQASVDYDVELDPRDLLASFLNADRAVKQSRPRRRDFDEDEPVADDEELVVVADERAASSGSDSDLPDIDDIPVRKTTAKGKGRANPSPPSSSAEAAPAPTNARRTSRTTAKAAPVPDDAGSEREPAPNPKSKEKKAPAKARGKGQVRKSDEGGLLDTEALLELLPKRKRRVVVELEAESDGEATDYDEGASLGKRKPANGRKNPKAAPKAKPVKSASRKKRAKVGEVEDEPDSELERARQKRLKEYKELGNFKLRTETTV